MSDDHDARWRARAEAAERTVGVLKLRVKALQNGAQSQLQHTLERARHRAAEVRRRQELLAVRNAELQRHSERLAAEVAARTRDLQVIFDNVLAGFLVVGTDGRVRPGFTRSCGDLVPGSIAVGASLPEVFALDRRAGADLWAAVAQAFEDVLPDEVTMKLIGRRLPGRGGGTIRIDARPIRVEGRVEALLLTLTDVTALSIAERENVHYRLLIGLLRQRDGFRAFLQDLDAQLDEAKTVASSDQGTVRRIVHTIKGNAACFGLMGLADLAHRVEDQPGIAVGDLVRLEVLVREFLQDNRDVLGNIETSQSDVCPGPGAIQRLRDTVAGTSAEAAVASWIAAQAMRPVGTLASSLPALAARVGERLGKRVRVTMAGDELAVDPVHMGPIVRELGHLVRNAIDHGIEPPEARGTKDITGRIEIRFEEVDGEQRITVQDDGRGMDPDALAARAGELGLDRDAHTRSQRLALALLDCVTTAAEVTEVSGRGVGLPAVAAAVSRVGGHIRLSSEPGRGTAVSVHIPAPDRPRHAVFDLPDDPPR